jgi:hypothetical protein
MRRTNAFVDPEDSQLVADAKNVFTEPVPYTYTEVAHLGHVECLTSESYIYFLEGCHLVQSWDRGHRERVEMDV